MALLPDWVRAPWGTFRPAGRELRLLKLIWSLPENRFGRMTGTLLRRPMKYGPLRPFDVEVWGQKLRLLSSGNISGMGLLYLPRFFDPLERALLAERLEAGATFVDVGANEGAYTFWVRSLLGKDCRLIAAEPDPDLVARLRFNLATNNVVEASVLPYAIADHDGVGDLSICDENRGENQLSLGGSEAPAEEILRNDRPAQAHATVRVQVRTLETALKEAGCAAVHAMKVDVEGSEEAVLAPFFRTAPESLWPLLLLMEYKENLPAHVRTRALLGDLGYRETFKNRKNLALERSG